MKREKWMWRHFRDVTLDEKRDREVTSHVKILPRNRLTEENKNQDSNNEIHIPQGLSYQVL